MSFSSQLGADLLPGDQYDRSQEIKRRDCFVSKLPYCSLTTRVLREGEKWVKIDHVWVMRRAVASSIDSDACITSKHIITEEVSNQSKD